MPIQFITDVNNFTRTHFFDWKDLRPIVDIVDGTNLVAADPGTGRVGFSIIFPRRCRRLIQGPRTKWSGNFNEGDGVLYTDGSSGPISILFDSPIRGIGAQIQERFGIGKQGGAGFLGRIKAFDDNHSELVPPPLDSSSTPGELHGISNSDDNGSAIFLGLLASSADIWSVDFSTDWLDQNDSAGDFAINTLSLIV
jgi:hypothetical protein